MKFKSKVRYTDAIKWDGENRAEVSRWLAKFGKFDSYINSDDQRMVITMFGDVFHLPLNHYIRKVDYGYFEIESANYFEANWEEVKDER